MRRLPRIIGGPTRMVCGCKHFNLVVRFTSFSWEMRAFPILPPSYLFFVLQKRMRSPLMGPNRGMSIGMTALANNNATNFNTKRNEKKKEKKRKKEDQPKKEKKRKKEDPCLPHSVPPRDKDRHAHGCGKASQPRSGT